MKIKIMTKPLLTLLFCFPILVSSAQIVPLFTIDAGDNCAPSEITIVNVINDAATYFWDFGNGETSTSSNPGLITYDSPGNYSIDLEVSTHLENRLLKIVRIVEAENTEVIEPLQFYTQIIDNSSNVIYRSGIIDRQDSITYIPHNAILDLNAGNYQMQIWDFEPDTEDNFLGTLSIQVGWNGQSSTVNGPLNVTVQLEMEDAAPNYSYAVDFEIVQPFITADGNQLTANAPLSSTLSNNTFTWYLDGIEIPNSDSLTITAPGSGVYTVFVDVVGGCQGLSTPFSFSLVNTKEVVNSDELNVFPNPFKEDLFIEWSDERPIKLTLVDISGRQRVLLWEMENDQIKLQTDRIPEGVYFLQLIGQERIFNSKLIIKQ